MTQYIINTKAGHKHVTSDLDTATAVNLQHRFNTVRDVLYSDEIVRIPVPSNRPGVKEDMLTIRAYSIESLTELS